MSVEETILGDTATVTTLQTYSTQQLLKLQREDACISEVLYIFHNKVRMNRMRVRDLPIQTKKVLRQKEFKSFEWIVVRKYMNLTGGRYFSVFCTLDFEKKHVRICTWIIRG